MADELGECVGDDGTFSLAIKVIEALLDLIADKWSALVIVKLSGGALRYGRLHREVDGISHKMLSQTLRNLDCKSLVKRSVQDTVPPQVEYALTEHGKSLLVPLAGLIEWAETHVHLLT